MLEELNFAYTDVYTGKAQTGEINAQVSLNEVYSKLSTEMKSHIYTLDGTSTISLVDSNQSSITLLNDAEAIGNTGTAGQNTISVEIHEERESTSYYLESDGIYYPMCIRNFKVELDEENASTTQPTGAGSLGSGIEISFIDDGDTEEKSESNFITAGKSGTTITLTAKTNTNGRTQVVVRDGEVTLTGNIEVMVNPTYTISLGVLANGSVSITTNNIDTPSNAKYGSGVEIKLTATGNTGYAFEKWYDNGTENTNETQSLRNITVSAETAVVTYTATFAEAVGYFKQEGTKAYYYPSQNATNEERIEITNNPTDNLATNPEGKKEYIGRYLGMKVNYTPKTKFTDRGTSDNYRLFYIDLDAGINCEGKYGDGQGTIYLKADIDGKRQKLASIDTTMATNETIMEQMNSKWNTSYSTSTYNNAKYVQYLLDKGIWEGYTDTGDLTTSTIAKYAVGAPSLEIWIDSYNAFLKANSASGKKDYNCTVSKDATTILTESTKKGPEGDNNGKGYYVGTNEQVNSNIVEAYYNGTDSNGYNTATDSLAKGTDYSLSYVKDRLKAWNPEGNSNIYWLASPSAKSSSDVMVVSGHNSLVARYDYYGNQAIFCPLICIKSEVNISEKK